MPHDGHNHSHSADDRPRRKPNGLPRNPQSARISRRAGLNLRTALWMNASFMAFEFVGAWWTGSVALLADAFHDLGDTLALSLGLLLQRKAEKRADYDFSYGYARYSLLSALIAGFLLLVGSVIIFAEALPRFWHPSMPKGWGMLGMSVIGITINGIAFFRLRKGDTQNEKILSWHMFEDFAGWTAVLIGSVLILMTHWSWIDPLLACGLAVFISWHAMQNLGHTLKLLLQSTPIDLDLEQLQREILALTEVVEVHDIHAWSLDGSRHVLSLHVVVREGIADLVAVKSAIRTIVASRGRFHTTLELETPREGACSGA